MTRFGCLYALFLLGCSVGRPQTAVSPAQVSFQQVRGGPIPAVQNLSISVPSGAAVPWTATFTTADGNPWIQLGAATGMTPGSVAVGLVNWRSEAQAPGNYTGTLTITTSAGARMVSVKWTVLANGPDPKFTYISGPVGCTQPSGYPDAALCTPPEEGSFQPPPAGGSYIDPTFGASVKILTPPGVYHTYYSPNPLSAKNKYLMTYKPDGSFEILRTASAKSVLKPSFPNQSFFWDAYDDEVYYYLSDANSGTAAVIKHDLRVGKDVTLADYAKDGHGFTSIERGGTGDTSKDNWISFFARKETQICALDLSKVATYCANYSATAGKLPYGSIDYSLISKGADSASGKRYVMVITAPAIGVFAVNLGTGKLDLDFRGPESVESSGNHDGICDPGEKCMGSEGLHADTLEDSSGIQYLVFDSFTNSPCEVSLSTYRLNAGLNIVKQVELGGGRKRVMSLWKCSFPGGTEDDVGCAKNAPYCVISTTLKGTSVKDPRVRFPHNTEVFVMRDNGAEIRRLAENRTWPFKEEGDKAYWSQPRAAISNDGSLVVSDSNFGVVNGQRVTMIQTGFGKPQVADVGVVNSASFLPSIAPGAIATVYGTNLASCASQGASALPLTDTMCASQVTFNGKPGLYFYASQGQLNTFVPASIGTDAELRVVVTRDGDQASDQAVVPAAQVQDVAPSIFTYSLADQVIRAVVENSDLSVNGPGRPARLGEGVVLYANGLGSTNPPVADGAAAPSHEPLARTVAPVQVFINNVQQTVTFSGLTPTLAGVSQVNFYVSKSTPVKDPDQNQIWLKVNGIESPRLAISIAPS